MTRAKAATAKSAAERHPSTVVCFGEVLWDCLPKGIFLGGAPINAAYHLSRQGLNVVPVTAVGRDFLGGEALRRITDWGLDTRAITRDRRRPTGTVVATLNASGSASYDFAPDVAWDAIVPPAELRRLRPSAIVFGTLALRQSANRQQIDRLLALWPEAIRIVDLNLRRPFDAPSVVSFALARAQLLKLNDDELRRIVGKAAHTPKSLGLSAKRLSEHTEIRRICVTAGEQGAGLWWDGEWFWEDARPVHVRDTVGAGDAFLGALVGGLWAGGATPQDALAQACRLGEFVASQDGATPAYQLDRKRSPSTLRV